MNVITIKNHRYRGQFKKIGDEYNATERMFLRVAKALGWVAEVPAIVTAQPQPVVAAVIDLPAEEKPKRTRRTYKRRDLTAEE